MYEKLFEYQQIQIIKGFFFSSSNSQISHMSKETGMDIYLKKDYMQYTGSFKERGARFTLLMLTDDQKRDGVIAASAGNHALALAYHGGQLSKTIFIK